MTFLVTSTEDVDFHASPTLPSPISPTHFLSLSSISPPHPSYQVTKRCWTEGQTDDVVPSSHLLKSDPWMRSFLALSA